MADALRHRGPDGEGVWADAAVGIALAHRRLSVLDLSPAGSQPMKSASGRFVIVFNGEIYNHLELRRELGERSWHGHSDTETLLAAVEEWGVAGALRHATGMFALAVWDRQEGELFIARDRLGEKPFYYGWVGSAFVFGSEIKALMAYPRWQAEVDRESLALYMRLGYVPAPRTIWRGISKLLPGTWSRIRAGATPGDDPAPTYYWRALDAASVPVANHLGDSDATTELEARLKSAVSGQMLADVPLGAFLSGGVDSSLVVAMMQATSRQPVKTFTIGFAESEYDEATYAKAVASHLGTVHEEWIVSPADAQAVIPRLSDIYDEPLGDSSQIPTHLVSVLARRHVIVSLSGDGGDELFGGYNRYHWGRRVWHYGRRIPRRFRTGAGRLLSGVSPATWDRLGKALPCALRQPTLGDRIHKLAAVLDATSPDELYARLIAQQREAQSIVIGAACPPSWADNEAAVFARGARGADFTERMMFQDLVSYLGDDILCKVDRAAMAISLETRVPLLDHRVVEFAWTLPLSMKIRGGVGKWLLREVLYRHVPRNLIERPKQGFAVPLDSWLRGPLRAWADDLLDESRLRSEGYIRTEPVRRRWQEHLSGRRNWQHWLWNVLMFQAWRARWD